MERSKFKSLTLINWNGFFARKFDLDQLVTTLSGGNGAGKSTTMAAFVTALIPDLQLLHFRNTTESGSTSASRDRGIHGKIKPGNAYSLLEIENSEGKHVIFGVRLQQVAGRDKKVELRLFSVHGYNTQQKILEIFTDRISDNQVQILNIQEIKSKLEKNQQAIIKIYNSILEYHSVMFDYGVLPRRLNSNSDRHKYYKLIEASLYGGISTSITKSLREYLLPDNQGIKKSFEEFEQAVRENRMTLNALNQTQRDRDFFKLLVNEAIEYVASDFMLQQQSRIEIIEQALAARHRLHTTQKEYLDSHDFLQNYQQSQQQYKEQQAKLIHDYQAADDYFTIVNSAVIDQQQLAEELAKQTEYQNYIAEQQEIYAELLEKEEQCKEQLNQVEFEQDSVREQLSDLQTALDKEQTRQLQARQAQAKFAKLIDTLGRKIEIEELSELQHSYRSHGQQLQNQLITLKNQLTLDSSLVAQFTAQLELLTKITQQQVSAEQSFALASQLIDELNNKKSLIAQESFLSQQLHNLQANQQNSIEQQTRQRNLMQQLSVHFENREQILQYSQELKTQLIEVEEQLENQKEALLQQQTEYQELINQQRQYKMMEIRYHHAQEQYAGFAKRLADYNFDQIQLQTNQQTYLKVTQLRQIMLELYKIESEQNSRLNQVNLLLDQQQQELQLLNRAELNSGSNLIEVAHQLGGEILAEIYDDISLEDANYYSALYGPQREAIIVPSLADITEKLADLDGCPDDLYLLESQFSNFDESMFEAQELGNGVLVKITDKQWRYSKLRENSSFGKAAREIKIQQLEDSLEQLRDEESELSFKNSSIKFLTNKLTEYLTSFADVDLTIDPQTELKEINQSVEQYKIKINLLNRNLSQLNEQQFQLETSLQLATRLYDIYVDYVAEDNHSNIESIKQQLTQINSAKQYIQQYDSLIKQLNLKVLSNPPLEQDNQLAEEQLIELEAQLEERLQLNFLLDEVISRKEFLLVELIELSENQTSLQVSLKERNQQLSSLRQTLRQQITELDQQSKESYRVLTNLQASLQTTQHAIDGLRLRLDSIVDYADQITIERAKVKRDQLKLELEQYQDFIKQQEIKFSLEQNKLEQITSRLTQTNREYIRLRSDVVHAKRGFNKVLGLIKQHNLRMRLNRPQLLQLSTTELRSKSDRALGMLRNIIGDNEYLRDSLRASEDLSQPELKIVFFLTLFDHLRERIRQDVITTDDPIEAIDLMEIEINKLTKLMKQREQDITISTVHVADILSKTIHREELRIQGLNQGLQSIYFGQVKSVRLTIQLRESHSMILHTLREVHDKHSDLFNNSEISFTQALGMLYQRLNTNFGKENVNVQSIGESLLDYRNYIELGVEVYRGADGWLKAESGALSTGEAIGTGMSILLMVIQTWEVESKNRRASTIIPCRLLFLDEAARLDSRSIETLFELCNRLEMQLVIAAPENISPKDGTTFRLMRKIHNGNEFVHVVALRGFGKKISDKLE